MVESCCTCRSKFSIYEVLKLSSNRFLAQEGLWASYFYVSLYCWVFFYGMQYVTCLHLLLTFLFFTENYERCESVISFELRNKCRWQWKFSLTLLVEKIISLWTYVTHGYLWCSVLEMFFVLLLVEKFACFLPMMLNWIIIIKYCVIQAYDIAIWQFF